MRDMIPLNQLLSGMVIIQQHFLFLVLILVMVPLKWELQRGTVGKAHEERNIQPSSIQIHACKKSTFAQRRPERGVTLEGAGSCLELAWFLNTEIGKKACLLSYSQAEPGRELTQPSPRLLAEPRMFLFYCWTDQLMVIMLIPISRVSKADSQFLLLEIEETSIGMRARENGRTGMGDGGGDFSSFWRMGSTNQSP